MPQKIKLAKPQLHPIHQNLKPPPTQQHKIPPNQQLIQVYKKYHINPMNSIFPSLPILIQIPIIIRLYFLLNHKLLNPLSLHPHFLCFNLTKPHISITIIPPLLYFIQPYLSTKTIPQQQPQIHYIMIIL
ncbi:YidC/Oxa1 family membrane protein insertase, partial [Staphylococcus warneri]|uniref:YidC/Oxa1 family membrane protein insertase n=1 Tax=Staphylococcus warneri TaxID=1292 RepID=UPI0034D969F3